MKFLLRKKHKLVQAWIELHRDELMADWELAISCVSWATALSLPNISMIRIMRQYVCTEAWRGLQPRHSRFYHLLNQSCRLG